MSKYILEINPEYEDKFRGVMILGAENSNLYVDSQTVDELEELNSDYINEHFGDLQDTAYQKGYADGKKEAESSEAIEQVKKDAFNKGMLFKEEKIHDAFLRGVEKGKAVHEKGCEGCEHECENKMTQTCILCCNAYKNRWIAKSDKIEVGDEVIYNGTTKCLVVRPETDERYAVLIDSNGNHHHADHSECKKTGRHFDIASILEAMKHD